MQNLYKKKTVMQSVLPVVVCHGDNPDTDGEFGRYHDPEVLPLKALESGAGWYVGTTCPYCGPYSRLSGYYPLEILAQVALDDGTFYGTK